VLQHHEPPVEVVMGGAEAGPPPPADPRLEVEVDDPGEIVIGATAAGGSVMITRRRTFFTITTGRCFACCAGAATEDAGFGAAPRMPIPVTKVAPPATQATARTRPLERRARR
jgi:hypothetical protein